VDSLSLPNVDIREFDEGLIRVLSRYPRSVVEATVTEYGNEKVREGWREVTAKATYLPTNISNNLQLVASLLTAG